MKTKDWERFQKYRIKKYLEAINSDFYRESEEREMRLLSGRRVKKKFLWFEWEEVEQLPRRVKINVMKVEHTNRDMALSEVPNSTVEECMDWLIAQRKKKSRKANAQPKG